MFANYVVLFVGYSCSDMLVHYLARSVSTKVSGRVFALEKEETALRKWQHRGIEPIRYSDYSQLPQLFDQWSRKIRLSLFERVNTVQSIATHCRELDYELDEGARAEFAQLFNGPFASREELAALADAFVSGESGLRGLELLQRGLTRFSMKTITRRGRHRSSAGHQMFLLAGTQRSSWLFPRRNASIFQNVFAATFFEPLPPMKRPKNVLPCGWRILSRSGFLPMGVAGTT